MVYFETFWIFFGNTYTSVQQVLKDDIVVILQFCLNRQNVVFLRNDYKQSFVLINIYFGGVPPGGIQFKKPGV